MASIHPDQIAPIVSAFRPSHEEVTRAGAILAAAQDAWQAAVAILTDLDAGADTDAGDVTDAANERVQVLDRTGQFLYAFNGKDAGGTYFSWNVGIAVDDQWGLYVLQYDNPRAKPTMIQKFQLT